MARFCERLMIGNKKNLSLLQEFPLLSKRGSTATTTKTFIHPVMFYIKHGDDIYIDKYYSSAQGQELALPNINPRTESGLAFVAWHLARLILSLAFRPCILSSCSKQGT